MSSILLPQNQNFQVTLTVIVGNELLPFNKQSTPWLPLICNLKKILKQTGNKNDRDDQFGDMVLIVRFSGLNNK